MISPSVELSIEKCIKCNICFTSCPVAAVTDKFPGPKYTAPQAGRFRKPKQPNPDFSVDYCSGCRACNHACPTGVHISEINARARNKIVEQNKYSLRVRFRNNMIARTEYIGKLGQPIAPLSNALLSMKSARKLMEKHLLISSNAPLPTFSKMRFSQWFRGQTWSYPSTREVVYFHGCSTEYFEPRIGRAIINILKANNFDIIIPPQNCCGLPLLSNGEFKAARKYHEHNVRNLVKYANKGVPIVGTSTSCTLTLKEEAPELLDMRDLDTRVVATHTFDFNEFILLLFYEGTLQGVNGNGSPLLPIPLTLGYHAPCQYRGHRQGNLAIEVLELIPGLKIINSNKTCCGIAGTYGYKTEKYEISMAVGQQLFDFFLDLGASIGICDSETCRWQISHGTGIPTIHPAELLAAAYGFPPEGALAKVLN